jgi:DNA-3-methyladenine glycosylase II
MKRLIADVGPCMLTPNPADPFTLLVRCVISQQISTKAAESIFGKLVAAVGGPPVKAGKLAKLTEARFKECGVSGPKQRTLRAVIDHVRADPRLLPGIVERDDDTIREQLTAIKGIGPWSVDMLLIFGMGRADVLPVGDYGFRSAVKNLFKLKELPKPDEATRIATPWVPYRSIATWYLWRSLENSNSEKA